MRKVSDLGIYIYTLSGCERILVRSAMTLKRGQTTDKPHKRIKLINELRNISWINNLCF